MMVDDTNVFLRTFNFECSDATPKNVELFNEVATKVVDCLLHEYDVNGKLVKFKDKDNKIVPKPSKSTLNTSTQLRRFYDEVCKFDKQVQDAKEKAAEEIKNVLPYLLMLNSKASYASGREPKLVSDFFVSWMKHCLDEVKNNSKDSLKQANQLHIFKQHFEAVIGFLRAKRK